MFRAPIKKGEEVEENIFWVTMSDLLLGLMIIFLTLFVLSMSGYSQEKIEEQKMQAEFAEELSKELKKQNIDVDIDKFSGQVKISDLELFETGSYTLSDKGKVYLNKFFPIYIDTLCSNSDLRDKVENIVVIGHADSQMFQGLSEEQHYARNVELSAQRAATIAYYAFQTKYDKKYRKKLSEILIVEGKSDTEPILIDGKEDFANSRRVELHIKMKAGEGILNSVLKVF